MITLPSKLAPKRICKSVGEYKRARQDTERVSKEQEIVGEIDKINSAPVRERECN